MPMSSPKITRMLGLLAMRILLGPSRRCLVGCFAVRPRQGRHTALPGYCWNAMPIVAACHASKDLCLQHLPRCSVVNAAPRRRCAGLPELGLDAAVQLAIPPTLVPGSIKALTVQRAQ